jgi:hypothetical protein
MGDPKAVEALEVRRAALARRRRQAPVQSLALRIVLSLARGHPHTHQLRIPAPMTELNHTLREVIMDAVLIISKLQEEDLCLRS